MWIFLLHIVLLLAGCSQPIAWLDTHTHLRATPGMAPVDPASLTGTAIALMDRRGVRKAILMPPPSLQLRENDVEGQLAQVARQFPERFAFMAGGWSLNPMIQQAFRRGVVSSELRRRFETRAEEIVAAGAVGFGEMTALHFSFVPGHPFEEAPPDHPLFLLLAEIAARHNVVIDLHMDAVVRDMPLPGGFSSPPNPRTVRENISGFERLLAHDRRARIVWAHVGWDNTGEMTVALLRRLLASHLNLYASIKIDQFTPGQSRYPQNSPRTRFGGIRPEWLDLLRSFPDRFVIGSDAFYGTPRQVEMVSQGPMALLSQLPPDLAQAVGYENAMRIYGIK